MNSRLHCTVPLPSGFRSADILAFHRRDAQEVSERVTANRLQKGLIWQGWPACLTVDFLVDQAQATLDVDGSLTDADQAGFEAMVQRMLGLTQKVEAFEQAHRGHRDMGRLIAAQAGLRVPIAANPYEALTWAITGQQITVVAAVSMRRKLIQAVNVRHASGLLCYPQAEQLVALPEMALREAGFSTSKAATLRHVSHLVVTGALNMDAWLESVPVDDMRRQLEAIRGIGPWTINYTLLRGFAWLDASLHGDVAVRRGLEALQGVPDAIDQRQAEAWLAPFSPWRALVAAHLWLCKQAADDQRRSDRPQSAAKTAARGTRSR